MSLTSNQITDNFQKQIGRAPTPYEITKYSNASIQDFTNLKGTFAKYNPDQSIVDYLAYQGQDPSMKARADLATMYGVTGYTGSFNQNVDLLNKMKTGKPNNQVGGTVAGATPVIADTTSADKFDRTTGQPNPNYVDPNASTGLNGTVAGAVNSTTTTSPVNDGTINTDPTVVSANNDYTSKVKVSAGLQKQVDDINNMLDRTLQDKRDEIARSGGIVNESQLRSTVLAENAPLLSERNDLVAQLRLANSDVNLAQKASTDAQNNFYKNLSVKQNQEKIDQSGAKIDIQQEQFAIKTDIQQTQFSQKLEQSGYKAFNIAGVDSNGNVTHSVVWTQNPASKFGVNSSGQSVRITTNSSGQPTANSAQAPGTTAYSSYIPPTNANYATSVIPNTGGLTQAQIDIYAQQTLDTGKAPTGIGLSSSGAGGQKKNAINNRMGEMAVQQGKTDLANNALDYQASLTFIKASNSTQQVRMRQAESSVEGSLPSLQSYVDKLNKDGAITGFKFVNKASLLSATNGVFGQQTASDAQALIGQIALITDELGQTFMGGNSPTDSAFGLAKQVLQGDFTADQFSTQINLIKTNLGIRKQSWNNAGTINTNGLQVAGSVSKGTTDAKTFVENTLVAHGLKYDDVIKKYTPTLQPGESLALDNTTGDVIAVTSADDKSKYTPL